jgi:hypothetical protein
MIRISRSYACEFHYLIYHSVVLISHSLHDLCCHILMENKVYGNLFLDKVAVKVAFIRRVIVRNKDL